MSVQIKTTKQCILLRQSLRSTLPVYGWTRRPLAMVIGGSLDGVSITMDCTAKWPADDPVSLTAKLGIDGIGTVDKLKVDWMTMHCEDPAQPINNRIIIIQNIMDHNQKHLCLLIHHPIDLRPFDSITLLFSADIPRGSHCLVST